MDETCGRKPKIRPTINSHLLRKKGSFITSKRIKNDVNIDTSSEEFRVRSARKVPMLFKNYI